MFQGFSNNNNVVERSSRRWWVNAMGLSTPDLRNRFAFSNENRISAKILISQLQRLHVILGDESKFSLGTAGSMKSAV